MFRHIMVPVDLAHADRLEHALGVAADLARLYDADVIYVGVTGSMPGPLGHNPDEYRAKLESFAGQQASARGVTASAHAAVAHDPTTEIDDALMKAVDATNADLVVMQSHIPGLVDYVWPSNGGKIAGHAKCSVFVVRG